MFCYSQGKCEQYWPAEKALVYGDLHVEHIGEDELEHYTTRDFVITSASHPAERKQSVKQVRTRVNINFFLDFEPISFKCVCSMLIVTQYPVGLKLKQTNNFSSTTMAGQKWDPLCRGTGW